MAKYEVSQSVNEITRVPFNTSFKGDINCDGDVRIDGKFEGNLVATGKVILGEKSVVKGEIYSGSIEILGSFTGNSFNTGLLSLRSTAIFSGVARVARLSINEGAQFHATCSIITDAEFATLLKERKMKQETNLQKDIIDNEKNILNKDQQLFAKKEEQIRPS